MGGKTEPLPPLCLHRLWFEKNDNPSPAFTFKHRMPEESPVRCKFLWSWYLAGKKGKKRRRGKKKSLRCLTPQSCHLATSPSFWQPDNHSDLTAVAQMIWHRMHGWKLINATLKCCNTRKAARCLRAGTDHKSQKITTVCLCTQCEVVLFTFKTL